MADTQIDELRLDITVEDNTSGESSSKKIRSLASAISRLNKVISNVDVKQLEMKFGEITNAIQPFLTSINSCSQVINSLSNVISNKSLAMQELNKAIDKTTTATIKLTNANLKLNTSYKGQFRPEKQANIEKLPSLRVNMSNEMKEYFNNFTNSVSKANTHLDKLLKSFARIAMYRAVRRTIQEITQAFMASTDAIAQYNSEFRTTMGNLQSSINIAKASMGVALYQALIVLEPVITKIAIGIANLANSISKVSANMRGQGKYLKVNTEYWKQYQSAVQGTLLSFDTFTTLSSKQQGYDPNQMFNEEQVGQLSESEERLTRIFSIFSNIKNLIISIKDALGPILDTSLKIIDAILQTGILKWFIDFTTTVIDALSETGLLEGAIWGLVTALAAIKVGNIISNITSLIDVFQKQKLGIELTKEELERYTKASKAMTIAISAMAAAAAFSLVDTILGELEGEGKKIASIIFIVVGALTALTAALVATYTTASWGTMLPILLAGVGASIAGVKGLMSSLGDTTAYADGGMFEGAGTMYALAGENGAEIVAQGSQGTGVANVEQIAEAEYRGTLRALYEYGAAQNGGMAINLDMNKLGTAIASNVGFRNEANRRNAGLNWK